MLGEFPLLRLLMVEIMTTWTLLALFFVNVVNSAVSTSWGYYGSAVFSAFVALYLLTIFMLKEVREILEKKGGE